MYSRAREDYYIVDGHVHIWDARASNRKNIHAKQFGECFYEYHKNLSPESEFWDYEFSTHDGGDRFMKERPLLPRFVGNPLPNDVPKLGRPELDKPPSQIEPLTRHE